MQRAIILTISLLIAPVTWAQQDPVADSLAQQVFEAAGGSSVWANVPYVVFSQATEINRTPNRVIRHL